MADLTAMYAASPFTQRQRATSDITGSINQHQQQNQQQHGSKDTAFLSLNTMQQTQEAAVAMLAAMKDESTTANASFNSSAAKQNGSHGDLCTPPMSAHSSEYPSPSEQSRSGAGRHWSPSPSPSPSLTNLSSNSNATFVHKLYNMVSDPSSQHLISWNFAGDSFVVANVSDFSSVVLPTHFKHSNFSSFVRQLNMYGFHKVNKSPRGQRTPVDQQIWEFTHPRFLQSRPDLLDEIKRKADSGFSSSSSPNLSINNVAVENGGQFRHHQQQQHGGQQQQLLHARRHSHQQSASAPGPHQIQQQQPAVSDILQSNVVALVAAENETRTRVELITRKLSSVERSVDQMRAAMMVQREMIRRLYDGRGKKLATGLEEQKGDETSTKTVTAFEQWEAEVHRDLTEMSTALAAAPSANAPGIVITPAHVGGNTSTINNSAPAAPPYFQPQASSMYGDFAQDPIDNSYGGMSTTRPRSSSKRRRGSQPAFNDTLSMCSRSQYSSNSRCGSDYDGDDNDDDRESYYDPSPLLSAEPSPLFVAGGDAADCGRDLFEALRLRGDSVEDGGSVGTVDPQIVSPGADNASLDEDLRLAGWTF